VLWTVQYFILGLTQEEQGMPENIEHLAQAVAGDSIRS
jgi:hypothetical protein